MNDKDEVPKEHEFDSDIDAAMHYVLVNNDGRCGAYAFRYQLNKLGLVVVMKEWV